MLTKYSFWPKGCRLFILALLAIGGPPAILTHAQVAEGLFATIETTQGTFTCQLEFERAPRTVANFVSLAEGSRPWVDFQKARISREPYYDNTPIHRIIKGFVIQGGSPSGTGTDGPGYRFRDELHAELKHDRAGVLSMAKTSEPHTNGSQFFVTLGATPWLDNVHSVFGSVVEGLAVVEQLGNVITDPADHPVEPQFILSVQITRQGEAALAFDPLSVNPPLPEVRPISLGIQRSAANLELTWNSKENHIYHAFFSPDLQSWSPQTLGHGGIASLQNFVQTVDAQFFFFFESPPDLPPTP